LLAEGTPINYIEGLNKIIDMSSLYIIYRAQIECYLMLHYINISLSNDDEGEFRYSMYQISGLNERQNYIVSEPDFKQKQKSELEIKNKIILNLEKNKIFKALTQKERDKIIKYPKARLSSWSEMIKKSSLKDEFNLNIWSLYSKYAHTEMIGNSQLKEFVGNHKNIKVAKFNSLHLARMLVCILIKDMAEHFTSCKDIFDSLTNDRKFEIESWIKFGSK